MEGSGSDKRSLSEMNDALDWEDLRLFYQVASLGSLAAASAQTGISSPTIGRRMLDLERATQRELFVRRQTGYTLAPDGKALFDRVASMQFAAGNIEAWRSEAVPLPGVDIAVDYWMARFLAAYRAALWSPLEPFQLCIKTGEERTDLVHRRAHITIARERPETGNVAVRRAPPLAYAPYCARDFDQAYDCNWISIGRGILSAPWANWASERSCNWITFWTDTPAILLDLVRAGAGRAVLPCHVGDADPDLVRAGEIIAELGHESWIVVHDDERKRPEVRTVIDRLADLLDRHGTLFSGQQATIGA